MFVTRRLSQGSPTRFCLGDEQGRKVDSRIEHASIHSCPALTRLSSDGRFHATSVPRELEASLTFPSTAKSWFRSRISAEARRWEGGWGMGGGGWEGTAKVSEHYPSPFDLIVPPFWFAEGSSRSIISGFSGVINGTPQTRLHIQKGVHETPWQYLTSCGTSGHCDGLRTATMYPIATDMKTSPQNKTNRKRHVYSSMTLSPPECCTPGSPIKHTDNVKGWTRNHIQVHGSRERCQR